jgi:hypothetical protein
VRPPDGEGGDPAADEDGSTTDDDPGGVPDDPERARRLRRVAEEVRGDSSESEQVAAILYRVSDLYDPAESTTPRDIYLNARTILRVKERGGMER